MKTLDVLTAETLDRLGDLDNAVWSNSEIELYVKDGYDLFCRRTMILYDHFVIENLPKVGNWQTDLERYLAEQKPGFGLTDEPFHFTGEHERNLGVNGRYGGTYHGPVSGTSPGEQSTIVSKHLPTLVPGGELPRETVEVLRVTYNNLSLTGISSAQMRRIDSQYEQRQGDPQWYIYDKDGLFYIRLVPVAGGDAAYDTVTGTWGTRGSWGLLRYREDTAGGSVLTPFNNHATLSSGIVAAWSMNETLGNRQDSVGTNHLASHNDVSYDTGKESYAASFTAANSQYLSGSPIAQMDDQWTLSMWAKYPGLGLNSGGMMSNGIGLPTDMGFFIRFDGITNGDITIITPTNSTDNGTGVFTAGGVVTTGQFYHILVTYDGSDVTPANRLKLYLNNSLMAVTTVGTLPASVRVGSELRFSRWFTNHSSNTTDEVYVWSRVLTAGERGDLYNSGNGRFYLTQSPTDTIVGSHGILRHRTDLFPAFGPWGTPRRIHPDTKNIKVELYRLGRDLSHHPSELPDAYDKYPIYWAMAQALRREGSGQSLELAQHYEQRFEIGVQRMTRKKREMDKERSATLGGRSTLPRPFGLGDPQAPYPYERQRY